MQIRTAVLRLFAAEQARRSSGLRLREKERWYHADAVGRVAARAVETVRRHLHGIAVQIRAVRLVEQNLRHALAVAARADDDAGGRTQNAAGKDLRRAGAAAVHQHDGRLVRQVFSVIALRAALAALIDKINKLSRAGKCAKRRHRRGGKPTAVTAQIHDPCAHGAVIFAHAVLKISPRLRAEAVAVDIAHTVRRADRCIRLHNGGARNDIVLLAAVRVADGDAHLRALRQAANGGSARLADKPCALLFTARRAGLALDGDDHIARFEARFFRAAALQHGNDRDPIRRIGDLRADTGKAHFTLHA